MADPQHREPGVGAVRALDLVGHGRGVAEEGARVAGDHRRRSAGGRGEREGDGQSEEQAAHQNTRMSKATVVMRTPGVGL